MNWASDCVAVIPCLNEEKAIASVVDGIRRHLPHVLVVDDGSSDNTSEAAAKAGAQVIRHDRPQGKGSALATGWRHAREQEFQWAMMLDGDGQHAPEDAPRFLQAAEQTKAPLIVGNRMANPHRMPWLRRMVNRWMSRRLSRLTQQHLPDSQCGFRLMNLETWSTLRLFSRHFEIESEMLVAFSAAAHPIGFVPIASRYLGERSSIHPIRDTIRWGRWLRSARSLRPPHDNPNFDAVMRPKLQQFVD